MGWEGGLNVAWWSGVKNSNTGSSAFQGLPVLWGSPCGYKHVFISQSIKNSHTHARVHTPVWLLEMILHVVTIVSSSLPCSNLSTLPSSMAWGQALLVSPSLQPAPKDSSTSCRSAGHPNQGTDRPSNTFRCT